MASSRPCVLLYVLLSLLVASSGCGDRAIAPSDVEGPFVWGSASRVAKVRHLYFGGQPDAAGLQAARDRGVEVVINLREPGELDWDEAATAEALGLAYYNVPIQRQGPFSREALERVEELVDAHDDEEIFIHCSSGNRAAGWLAVHLAERHGMDEAAALAVGRAAGITKDGIVEKVRSHLRETAAPDAGAR